MVSIENFEAFLIASIIMNLTPGVDTMYILGRSVSEGKKAGVFSALGIGTGALLHCIFAALGLSILLSKSAIAFDIIKYAGAAYLVYLGVKILLSKSNILELQLKNNKSIDYKKIYFSGILTNILNPKVALFFIAFLPQFIDSSNTKSAIPFFLLGLTFVTTGTIWSLILAIFAGNLSKKIRDNIIVKIWLDRITAFIFILLGVHIAFLN